MFGIKIKEIKNLYGDIDFVKKLEHYKTKFFWGIKINDQSYIETFYEEDGSNSKKHSIGFNIEAVGKKQTNDERNNT